MGGSARICRGLLCTTTICNQWISTSEPRLSTSSCHAISSSSSIPRPPLSTRSLTISIASYSLSSSAFNLPISIPRQPISSSKPSPCPSVPTIPYSPRQSISSEPKQQLPAIWSKLPSSSRQLWPTFAKLLS